MSSHLSLGPLREGNVSERIDPYLWKITISRRTNLPEPTHLWFADLEIKEKCLKNRCPILAKPTHPNPWQECQARI